MELHKPVLLKETLEGLAISPSGLYLDATLGRGGHARALLAELGDGGRLIGIDADPEAIAYARQNFADEPKLQIYHENFSNLDKVCQSAGGCVRGVLLDLGVSSPQLDQASRGFSFSQDGPLDMRMNPTVGISAQEWLASASESEMAQVFFQYGEERYSRRIAKALARQRDRQRFTSTASLAQAVKAAHPRWQPGKHPATRVFQAIRIHVNNELESLEHALTGALKALTVGGRLAVISFHSLEDRLVKRKLRGDQPRGPRHLPPPNLSSFGLSALDQGAHYRWRPIGKKIRPGAHELADNPRARSAVLRVAEKAA